jgi:hypothetical protein
MKRLGPDLKMPNLKLSDLKTPDFLTDLLYDLRDRRLLAPIAFVLVAIAAAPFLLGGGSDEPAPTPSAGTATVPAGAPTLTVVEAKPGLREYRKRLARRQPTDPFKQLYTGAKAGAGAESNGPSSATTTRKTSSSETAGHGGEISSGGAGTGSSSTSGSGAVPSSPPSPSASPSDGGTVKHHLTFYTWGISVWISKVPSQKVKPEAQPEITKNPRVLPQTAIPGTKAPVVTYLGLSRKAAEKKEGKALLLVSDEVTEVSDNAECVSGREGCQLIEAKEGEAITFTFGPGETRYTIKVLKIELVVTGHSEHHS